MSEPKFYPLNQSPFYKLASRKRLAEFLGVKTADLRSFEKAGASYKEWDEEKKSGGFRHIENPARPLKLLQRVIGRKLSKIAPPDHLFCPVKRRSFVHNAKAHAGSRVVRTLDIKKYFPSTSSKRVFWFWHKRMKCASDIAGILTALSCWNGHLPTGSPLSPILSFYAHMDIWENIATIAKAAGCKITVYIDDVTVSGDKVPDKLLWHIKQEIKRARLKARACLRSASVLLSRAKPLRSGSRKWRKPARTFNSSAIRKDMNDELPKDKRAQQGHLCDAQA